jgi:hypothetical protein
MISTAIVGLKPADGPLTAAQEIALRDILSHCPRKRAAPCWTMGALGAGCPKCWECAQVWCCACDDFTVSAGQAGHWAGRPERPNPAQKTKMGGPA